ncbi:MAG: hypothetical protein H6627_13575 [Calditrichae bacterium]|nr:hypothetical protein [Calditrichota bacterium]MCB9059597.1 hypothetical protein [Calditrichia bacterium]
MQQALDQQKKHNTQKQYIGDLVWVFSFQVAFQIIFTGLLYFNSLLDAITTVQYINTSCYFLIALLSFRSLKYTIANRPLVILFMSEFLYLIISSTVLLFAGSGETPEGFAYNLFVWLYRGNTLVTASIMLLITAYLFFFSISPRKNEAKKHFTLASIIVLGIILLSYSNVNIFANYWDLGPKFYEESRDLILVNTKYVYLINLSFLLFIWFTYNQGHYILSEYLPALISIHTLMITNEIYQLHNNLNLIDNYIPALYFNTIVNFGFISLLMIRLYYLTKPESKKNEHYVLNYDLLKGFVDKPHRSVLEPVLIKLGKQRLYFGSILIFILISVPLLFFGEISFFTRFNIVLMFFFIVGVMVYAIIYTQRKWHDHIGFLIHREKNK